MISFIDEHRSVLGVEPICRLLPIAPATYYEVVAKRTDVGRPSAREGNDTATKVEIRRVFNENFQVYGVRKVWRQLQREGFDVARKKSIASAETWIRIAHIRVLTRRLARYRYC